MEKKYMLIILASTILGVLIGSVVKDFESKEGLHISKDNMTTKEIRTTKKSIKKLKKEKEKLDNEINRIKKSHTDTDSLKEIEKFKDILSYTDVEGKGIIIKLDGSNESIGNIANMVDYNKILINLVNDLKINGAKFISINNQRINQYSEIILAGNHININSTPIAQPYEIEVMGNIDKLTSYLNENNNYIENIIINYPIKVEYKINESISIPKIEIPNKLRYIKEG